MRYIERKDYLNWLVRHRDRQIVKVVSGVRRCGKSTLFAIYGQYLREHGVAGERIVSINFEDISHEELWDYRALYRYVEACLVPEAKTYVFLDEVRHVPDFQKAVDSLLLKENCDLYLTASNACFMSGEPATPGRYVELEMLPLSFGEFCAGLNEEESRLSGNEKLDLYIRLGSFPHVHKYGLCLDDARDYMRAVYEGVLFNDIVKRFHVADVNMLEEVTRFLLRNIGYRTSPASIANAMASRGRKIDPKTVDRYLHGLTEGQLFFQVRRYNIRGREPLSSINKYYVADVALRDMLVRTSSSDIGHILENLVYLELQRRGYQLFVGQLGADGEVDFVAIRDDRAEYYQVAATTLSEDVLVRELAPLQKIRDNYPKYLLTLDTVFAESEYSGVQKKNVLNWVLAQVV